MRLTVGPLPAAVYWRRRLLVLGVLVLIVVGIIYACTGGPDANQQARPDPASQTQTPDTTTPTTEPSPTRSPTSSPTPTAFTLPVAGQTGGGQTGAGQTGAGQSGGGQSGGGQSGPCTDDEIELTASAAQATLVVGQGTTFTLTIKNISNRSCVRDIGSIPQELQLRRADGTIAWSSDDCRNEAIYGPDYNFETTLAPGEEKRFDIYWNGYRTRTGTDTVECTPSDNAKPHIETHSLIARLGTKLSEPVPVSIRSS
jgi:hypothetical protein